MTITAEHIPPEVVQAAARAAWDTQREHWGLYKVMLETEGHLPPYEELGRGKQRELLVEARAAIAAALAAWPGAKMRTTFWPNEDGVWVVPRHMWSLPIGEQEPGK